MPHEPLSVEEYLKLEETSQIRHEYVGGTSRHNVIAGNLFALLWNAARGGPCRVYGSDMILSASEEDFYYPDVTVVCGDEEAGDEALYQVAPCLVVEVTSPSAEATDRRERMLAAGTSLPCERTLSWRRRACVSSATGATTRDGGGRPRRSDPKASCPSPAPRLSSRWHRSTGAYKKPA